MLHIIKFIKKSDKRLYTLPINLDKSYWKIERKIKKSNICTYDLIFLNFGDCYKKIVGF